MDLGLYIPFSASPLLVEVYEAHFLRARFHFLKGTRFNKCLRHQVNRAWGGSWGKLDQYTCLPSERLVVGQMFVSDFYSIFIFKGAHRKETYT